MAEIVFDGLSRTFGHNVKNSRVLSGVAGGSVAILIDRSEPIRRVFTFVLDSDCDITRGFCVLG